MTPADRLVASMAAEVFWSIYLHAGIGGVRLRDKNFMAISKNGWVKIYRRAKDLITWFYAGYLYWIEHKIIETELCSQSNDPYAFPFSPMAPGWNRRPNQIVTKGHELRNELRHWGSLKRKKSRKSRGFINNDDVKHNFSTLLARCYVVTSFCNIWWHHFEWLAHFGFWINR